MEINPGGQNGGDFKITIEKTGSAPRDIKYHVMALRQTSFTQEEIAFFKKGDKLNDLENIFKVTPQSELEDKLGLTEGGSAGGSEELSPSTSGSSDVVDGDSFAF